MYWRVDTRADSKPIRSHQFEFASWKGLDWKHLSKANGALWTAHTLFDFILITDACSSFAKDTMIDVLFADDDFMAK